MSKKGAAPINEALTEEQKQALTKAADAQEPQAHPTLTADQKVQILSLQRNAMLAENSKLRTDQAFEKAMSELNKAYQTVNNIQGFALDQMTLEFVSTQG